MSSITKLLPLPEFIFLLTVMITILAMATDVMLPGLDVIALELGVKNPNNAQHVILFLFIGYTVGQLIAGPLSDSIGRKPVIYLGYTLFIVGCLISMFAQSFTFMLIGRFLQGIGASGPRIVSVALVRDLYEGRSMAKIMSIIMGFFILVPAIAPLIGQGIIFVFGWRATFGWLLLLAIIAFVWFAVRQPETLVTEARKKFSLREVVKSFLIICKIRVTMSYSIACGIIFGAFVSYIGSSQQIYSITFKSPELFPLYFGGTALTLGIGSMLNSRLVMTVGMRVLTRLSFTATSTLSLLYVFVVLYFDGIPPLWTFLVWNALLFISLGFMFGNINAIAMEPLGKMAGIGAALIGSLTTLISLPIAWVVGQTFDGGITPLVLAYAITGIISLAIILWAELAKSTAESIS